MAHENTLIQSIQAGDTSIFGELYERYIEKIYRFVYFKTHHKQTAEDLTSQSFFKALENIHSFDTKKGSFQSWIYRIAHNTVIDYYRTYKSTQDISDVWDVSSTEDIEKDTDIHIKLEQVEEYIKNLQPDQRDVLIMRLWQDLSFKEIAEILGKTEASCKMTYKRTVEKLRKEMPIVLVLLALISV